jgi:hypothetical protein
MTGSPCRIVLAVAIAAAVPAAASAQATIQLFNADPAGVGFNDPTPATPVGGNPGTTVGLQRQFAFVRAAQIWGQTLSSQLPIRIVALHDPTLPCTDTAAALAGAAPFASVANIQAVPGFPGLTPDTWYPISLAEKRTNVPLADLFLPTQPFHILTIINPRIGEPGCLPTSGWYYGLDTNAPAGQVNFVTVLLHELGHGFGFTVGPTNASTGVRSSGLPSVWEAQMLDVVLGGTWRQMNDAARAFSARNGLNLVWQGSQTALAVPETLAPGFEMVVQGAPAAVGTFQAEPATFGGPLPPDGLRAVVSPAVDLGGVSRFDGCEPIVSDVAGRIALVDRGTCTIPVKAQHAQDAGAVALIVANNLPGMFLPGCLIAPVSRTRLRSSGRAQTCSRARCSTARRRRCRCRAASSATSPSRPPARR